MAPSTRHPGGVSAEGLAGLVAHQGPGDRSACLFFGQDQAQAPIRGIRCVIDGGVIHKHDHPFGRPC